MKQEAEPGPTIVDERNRTPGDVGDIVFGITDEEEAGLGRAVSGLDDIIGGGGGVLDFLPPKPDGVMRDGRLFFQWGSGPRRGGGHGRLTLFGGAAASATSPSSSLRVSRKCGQHQRETKAKQAPTSHVPGSSQ